MVWRFQTAITLIVAAIFVLLIGFLRPPSTAKDPEAFWAQKIRWGPEYDVVLAGDSRVNQGLSPAAMTKILAEHRIINFGFDSVAFTSPYLDAVENLLDPHSDKKTIVIGITPLSLTPMAAEENQFLDLKKRHPVELYQRVSLEGILNFFRPYDWEAGFRLRRMDHRGRIRVFHPDGFIAATMVPEQPRRSLDYYTRLFKSTKVSQDVIEDLIGAVRKWRNIGIDVYGFRVPTSPEMIRLEDRLSGFDESALGEQFESAGGKWLSFPAGEYYSYDASHLREDHARRLSRALARKIYRKQQ